MPTELLPIGMPVTLVQNTVYALPAVKCTLIAEGSPTIAQSNAVGFSNSIATTLTGGAATVSGGFIKSTAGAAVITLKRD